MSENFKICLNESCGIEFNAKFSKFPNHCSRECQKTSSTASVKKQSLKTPRKGSVKRELENEQYKILRTEFLSKPENKICPIMKTETTDVHHKKGRIGKLLLDTRYWIALSRQGHRLVEENPEWAKENGYSLNRLDND